MSKKLKIFIVFAGILAIAAAFTAYYFYHSILTSNVQIPTDRNIYIRSGSKLSDVLHTFDTSQILKNPKTFVRVAQWMNYGDAQIAPGKYTIKPNWNNRQIVSLLRYTEARTPPGVCEPLPFRSLLVNVSSSPHRRTDATVDTTCQTFCLRLPRRPAT